MTITFAFSLFRANLLNDDRRGEGRIRHRALRRDVVLLSWWHWLSGDFFAAVSWNMF